MAKLFSALTRNVAPLALLVLALGLSACASGAKPGAMLAPNTAQTTISANSNLREAVGIGQVSGGRETNPLWVSDVSSSDLAEALRLIGECGRPLGERCCLLGLMSAAAQGAGEPRARRKADDRTNKCNQQVGKRISHGMSG